ncbi:similar to Saccharomyces cerevisiae YLL015W BPT1 ABC type transmembrane transporter of MRP/CFTR family [Maudiozyma saulgeensis]|uniref:Similar to Saccharomyces cerevisiae YLL015W BPT1 ABC type transmembrane transporter of MRP/CFTR family n=1 Tax=Maudiozyma saulgeensis TaxID=1789683 RepID=A0A1X7RBK5_9SACH|nr:similar to Saccharomyces cerevisiae YLL015W BPT1 ABC type transmembrane transporter of MRP/CFTR family [Kazachstania saulgeensis]
MYPLFNNNTVSATCKYGYEPYIDSTTNALNPCFLGLVSTSTTIFFIIVGLWQLFNLYLNTEVPRQFNKNIKKFQTLSTSHISHLTSILFQATCYYIQLMYIMKDTTQSYPPIIKYSIISNLCYSVLISLPTQYIQYFKSICAIGNQLFFYLVQILFLSFQILQRYYHSPDESYNLIHGNVGMILEIIITLNATLIFVYDLALYKPSQLIIKYYDENDIFHSVNVFSNLTYMWMNKLISETYENKKLKDPNHLPLPPINLNIRDFTVSIEKNWEYQRLQKKNSLLTAIWKTFGKTILLAMFMETVNDLLNIIEPQILRLFIKCFNKEDSQVSFPPLHGVFLALSLFLINIISTILKNQFFITIFEAGLGIRGSVASLVYQKTLKLSSASRGEYTTGDILNLLSVDVLRLQRFFENSQTIIGAPLQIVTVLISLYFLLGKAIIGGLLVMAIMIPVNSFLSRKIKKLTKTQMKFKDIRIKTITEILSSIKSIKFYAWEKPMLEKLNHVRNDQELKNLKKIGIASSLIYFAWNCVPLMVTCSSFLIFSYVNDYPLTPELVFPSLSLFNILNMAIYEIPSTINTIIETNVSMGRLKKFLLAEEIDTSFIEKSAEDFMDNDVAIEIENATFLWKSKNALVAQQGNDEEESIGSTEVALKNIDKFTATSKELTCIVGRVGSGKTTLLRAILGQLPCVSGSMENKPPRLYINGREIAYCPQEAWIMNQSIKENILFGRKFNRVVYDKTIQTCQLVPDFSIFSDGDETIVGEKGISLSGGQKARLALARAVYAQADIYLLDDILSAVDAGVRKNIIHDVIDRDHGLLKDKTVILSTNTLSVLKFAKNIYVMQAGSIVEEGTYQESILKEAGDSLLTDMLLTFDSNNNDQSGISTPNEEIRTEIKPDSSSEIPALVETLEDENFNGIQDNTDVENIALRRSSFATLKSLPLVETNDNKHKTGQKREKTAEGRVKLSVYMTYAKACGLGGVVLFGIFLFLARIFDLGERFWLKYWSESNEKTGKNGNVFMFVSVYALIGVVSAGFSNLRTIILLIYCSIRASKNLHNRMAYSIIRSPMQFFETTPVGRIINRFSSDIDSIDSSIQNIFAVFSNCVLDYLVTIILIGYNMPWFFVFNGVLLILYYQYQKIFMVQSRELKRLTSISYSPIMSLMSETLGGRSVIAAYDQNNLFIHYNQERVQNNVDCVFTYRSTNRWLSIRLQAIGAFVILCTALLTLSTINTENQLGTGMVGLMMSYVLSITMSLTWIVRSSVLLETNVVSVERVVEYCDLQPEAPEIISGHIPENGWPSKGSIEFHDYTTSYRADLNPVLKDISIKIQPGEKIGIVGRTGAGKSTLTLALFRLLEATEGSILVDGVDISTIGLETLRSNLAIIPQDAQAFEGNVRYNLDPFNKHTDDDLWNALALAHLQPHLVRLAQGDSNTTAPSISDCLAFKVAENGSNLSLGQRQLLCLARALLNKSRILVLDEATAAVDMETDRIIQETIRTQFKTRTILTIAHRIDTVLDNDKILVLDQGSVKEFDSPQNLLAQKDSLFYHLCEKGNYIPQSSK